MLGLFVHKADGMDRDVRVAEIHTLSPKYCVSGRSQKKDDLSVFHYNDLIDQDGHHPKAHGVRINVLRH